MLRDRVVMTHVRGRLTVSSGAITHTTPNQIQYGWGAAAAKLLATGNPSYRISAMYIEFENVESPEDAVSVPTFDRSEGREYYENLGLLADRDFLRVGLLAPPDVAVVEDYEEYLPAGEGNLLTFYTQTQGAAGYHGRTFNHSVNSKVFGAALVVTPDGDDPTKDIIVARTYLAVEEQVLKIAARQIGLTWQLSLL